METKTKKSKRVEAIFINAITQEISRIVLNEGGAYREMYRLLKMPDLRPVNDINVVRLDDEAHYINVDGEGLLKDPEHFILWKGYAQPLAGNAIIIRVNDEGDTVSVRLSVATVKRHVQFVRLKMHGFVQKTEQAVIFGKPGIRHTNIPVFTERREPGTGKPLDMTKIAKHMGVPPEMLQWTVLPEDDDEPEPSEPEEPII
jgi:hypothetical protein